MINPNDINRQARCFLKRPARRDSSTGYKGVLKSKKSDRFYVRVWTEENPHKSLGGFSTAEAAGRAYDDYIREFIGSWCYTNFHKNGKRNLK